jgi:hypothetical protein
VYPQTIVGYTLKVGLGTLPGGSARNGVAAVCTGEAAFPSDCNPMGIATCTTNVFKVARPNTACLGQDLLELREAFQFVYLNAYQDPRLWRYPLCQPSNATILLSFPHILHSRVPSSHCLVC